MSLRTDQRQGVGASAPTFDPIQAAGFEYCSYGWLVLALNGKVPLASSHGVRDASADPALVARWPGGCNAGVAGGNGLVMLDVDYLHGGDDTLHQLERAHGPLPRTVSATTGSGGAHYYFKTGTSLGCSVGALGPGLDTRGEGGYVVAPPSIHPDTGHPYCWDVPPSESELAVLPDWLAALLKENGNGNAHPVEEWRELASKGVAEGARNDRTAQLVGHLLGRGVDPFVVLELVLAWDAQRNRPPLGGDVVARTVRSIARREARKWTS